MIGCLTEITTCVVAKPLVIFKLLLQNSQIDYAQQERVGSVHSLKSQKSEFGKGKKYTTHLNFVELLNERQNLNYRNHCGR